MLKFEFQRANSTNAFTFCFNFLVQRRKQDKPRVTMKIIDFANVSFPTAGEETSSHHGPDDGFIMGLDNLYTILQTILEEDQFYL